MNDGRENGARPASAVPMTFRGLMRLMWRTLPYLKQASRDLLLLGALALGLLVVVVPIALVFYDLAYNRMLLGKPLAAYQAGLFRLDPAIFVDVEALTVEAREVLRMRVVVFVLGAAAALAPLGLLFYLWWVRLQQRVNQALRVQMVQQVQAMSMRFHSGAPIGDSIYRAYQDSAMVTSLMAMMVKPLPWVVFTILALLAFLALEPRLCLLMIASYVVMFLIARAMTPGMRTRFRTARETNSELTSRIQETMAALKVVKAFGTESVEQARFEEASERAFDAACRARMHATSLQLVGFVIVALPAVFTAVYEAVLAGREAPLRAGAAVGLSGYTAWSLAAFSLAVGRAISASRAVSRLVTYWSETQDMAVGMDRALLHADLEPEVQDDKEAIPFPGLQAGVAFRGVSFAYQKDRPVLSKIDLELKAGEVTALVGPTGSGKSTLVNLLLRLFDPDEGRIEIGGTDLRKLQIESLRSNVSIALQENLLFGTTIAENIRYAVPDASDEAVQAAAKVACADEFIQEQQGGYHGELGERGSKLSTGQRQRLSIARAVIKDTPILVLDEPTASLDAETEMKVLENLATWGRGRAIVVIAHRLSTIRRADKIVYLRDGSIVETGTHAELVQAGGAYRRFVDLEQGGDLDPEQGREAQQDKAQQGAKQDKAQQDPGGVREVPL